MLSFSKRQHCQSYDNSWALSFECDSQRLRQAFRTWSRRWSSSPKFAHSSFGSRRDTSRPGLRPVICSWLRQSICNRKKSGRHELKTCKNISAVLGTAAAQHSTYWPTSETLHTTNVPRERILARFLCLLGSGFESGSQKEFVFSFSSGLELAADTLA